MNKIAVIGAGIIGSSWAIVFARKGLQVRLYDHSPSRRFQVPQDLRQMLQSSLTLIGDGETAASVADRITVCDTLAEAVETADLIQEAVSERLDLKTHVFEQIEAHCSDEAIISSSSSTYGVSRFASHLRSRHRCLVLHPMTPPHIMPIVEVIAAPFTSEAVVLDAERLMRSMGQAPVRVLKENDSFVLNRLQGALLLEMFNVIAEGLVSVKDADTIISQGLGLRWAALGPLQGIDLNAPDGIRDYLERYGHIFNQMSRSRGGDPVVDASLCDQLDIALRQQLPLEGLNARRSWRDNAISTLRQTLATLPEEDVHESDCAD